MTGDGTTSVRTPKGVPKPWERRFAGEVIAVEKARFSAAALGLLVMAVVHGVTGLLYMPNLEAGIAGNALRILRLVPDRAAWPWAVSMFSVAGASVVVAVVLGKRRSSLAAVAAAVLAVAGSTVAALTGSWICAAVSVGALLLVVNAVVTKRTSMRRIAAEADRSPLVLQYRLLVRLLVRMMVSDRHADRREATTIMRICDSMRISKEAQRLFVEEALDGLAKDPEDLAVTARRYVELADRESIPHARTTALLAATAVAAADGLIGEDEETELRALAGVLGMDKSEVSALIAQHRAELEKLTPEVARAILGVGADAGPDAIEDARARLVDDLADDDYEHIGHLLVEDAKQRRALVERAYRLLAS